MASQRLTMFEKIWSRHVVAEGPGGQALLYVDRHLLHEGSTHALARLERKGRAVRRPAACLATADHYVPTQPGAGPIADPEVRAMVADLDRHSRRLGITFFGRGEPRQGIVHGIGPEQGATQPGITLVCGDSHTATHGAFGALACGIGSTEVEHVLATQCLATPAEGDAHHGDRLAPGTPLAGTAVSRVFIGSCTNSRLEDLRAAAAVAKGRRAAVPAWVVPGSAQIKRATESEGLDRIFTEAGFEWREPGCSMCVGMNGDTAAAGERVASTSNRNFEGRQGRGARTHLMSPAMAAAAAVTGRLTDVRTLGR